MLNSAQYFLIALVLVPLACSCAAFLAGRYLRKTIVIVSGVFLSLVAGALGAWVYWEGPIRYSLSGWGAPLGIDLCLDGLSSIMLLLTSIVGTFTSIYSEGYFSHESKVHDRFTMDRENFFWPLWLFCWGAINALFLTSDIFNVYVALELMTFSAVALITLASTEIAISSAAKYLFATLLGSLAYLLGVGLLYSIYGVLDIFSLGEMIQRHVIAFSAVGLMTVGIGIKSALFPMHFWLPSAHANAPSPVSVILSALVITAPFYLLVRLWHAIFSKLQPLAAAQCLGVLGSAAIVWGSLQALRQKRLKMLIAYSTVAQIGYMFLFFPLSGAHFQEQIFAWSGGIYFAISHAFAKAAAFMAAGSIMLQLGHDTISDFKGLARSSPMNVFVFALAGVNLMGMPPSGGFVAKWLLLKAALFSGQWGYVMVIMLGSLLAACYIFRVIEITLHTTPSFNGRLQTCSRMQYASLVLVLVPIILGLGASIPLNLIQLDFSHFIFPVF